MLNLLIDTEFFDRTKHYYGNRDFTALADNVSSGKVQVFLTSVIEREVLAHLRLQSDEALGALKKLLKTVPVLQHPSLSLVKLRDGKMKTFHALRVTEWEKWKADCDVTLLPLEVDLEEVLGAYFDKRPPFGDGKKKHEFPDALTLATAVAWCKANEERMAIVSGDPDVKEFCDGRKDLLCFETLAPFLELMSDKFIVENVKKGLAEWKDDTLFHAKQFLTDEASYSPADDYYDVTVEDVSIIVIDIARVAIVKAEHGSGVAELTINVSYELEVSFPDPSTGMWDSETHSMWGQESVETTLTNEEELIVQVEFTYDEKNPSDVDVQKYDFGDEDRTIPIDINGW